MTLFACALGLGTMNAKGEWLEVFYPVPHFRPDDATVRELARIGGYDLAKGGNRAIQLHAEARTALKTLADPTLARCGNSARPVVATFLEVDTPPQSVPEAYLKL